MNQSVYWNVSVFERCSHEKKSANGIFPKFPLDFMDETRQPLSQIGIPGTSGPPREKAKARVQIPRDGYSWS